MSLRPDRALALRQGPLRVTLSKRDSILYALGVGFGFDPLDTKQLRYVYEDGLVATPTMSVVVGAQAGWLFQDPDAGIDPRKVVHGEQGLIMHGDLPVEGDLVADGRVVELVDKGAGSSALIVSETTLSRPGASGPLATLSSTIFVQDGGGFGGTKHQSHSTTTRLDEPSGPPTAVCDLPTVPQSALIYRLSGDTHALHVDPDFARAAGFDRPLLHGRCTFAIAGHAILRTLCDYDPTSLRSLSCRFSGVVFPGETVRTQMWKEGNRVQFVSLVVERDEVVLSRGVSELRN
jgi:acyl dehydratase